MGGAGCDFGCSVQQTSDQGYIIAGRTSSFGNGFQIYLVKTDASGDTLWTRTYGDSLDECAFSVQQTSDGGYILTGVTLSFGNGSQAYLIKTDASGDTLWTRTFGGAGSEDGHSVQQNFDGGYIVAGYTLSFGDSVQLWLLKTNASGDTLWAKTFGGVGRDYGTSVQQTIDGGYIIAGFTTSFGNGYQVYLLKSDANGNVGAEDNTYPRSSPYASRLTVSPNPFVTFATVSGHSSERFALYDVSGRLVGTFKGDRIGEGLAPGVYFIQAMERKDGLARIVKIR